MDLPESQCPHPSNGDNKSILNVTRIKVKNKEDREWEDLKMSQPCQYTSEQLILLLLLSALSFTEYSAFPSPFLCPLSSDSPSISFLFNNNEEEEERN